MKQNDKKQPPYHLDQQLIQQQRNPRPSSETIQSIESLKLKTAKPTPRSSLQTLDEKRVYRQPQLLYLHEAPHIDKLARGVAEQVSDTKSSEKNVNHVQENNNGNNRQGLGYDNQFLSTTKQGNRKQRNLRKETTQERILDEYLGQGSDSSLVIPRFMMNIRNLDLVDDDTTIDLDKVIPRSNTNSDHGKDK